MVKRGNIKGTLDHGLKQQAKKAGVEIIFNKTIPSDEADIIATGPVFKESFAIDRGIVFKTKSEDKAIILLNDNFAFKGYSYLLITKGYGCMCSVTFDEIEKIEDNISKSKNFFKEKYDFDIKFPKNVGGTGTFAIRHRLEIKHKKNKTLLVGEAAGFQDCLWGFGMRYAFESGYLAAKSIIDNFDYEKSAKKEFRNKLRAGIVNRYFVEKFV